MSGEWWLPCLYETPALHFRADDVDEAETYGFEGLDIWRVDDQLLVRATYDNEQASIYVPLDAAQVQQLRDLLDRPRRFDPADQTTWPEIDNVVLLWNNPTDSWQPVRLKNVRMHRQGVFVREALQWVSTDEEWDGLANYATFWLPHPPAPPLA